jgi:tetratricopeptide (TPR) repeat protein
MKRANLILMAALAAAGLTTTGALLVPATAFAAAEAAAEQKVSAKLGKPLRAAQEAIQAKNYPEAFTQLDAAAAIEPKTAYDSFMIDELRWFAQVQTKDYAGAVDSLTRAVNSGFVPATDLARRYKALTQLNYELKAYPKAIEWGKKALELEPGSKEVVLLVAHSLYLQKDFAGARTLIDTFVASGTKPDEQLLLIYVRSSAELNDRAGTMRGLEMLVRNYSATKYWEDLLNNQLYETKADRDLRALYRLMVDTNTLNKADEFSEMATTLLSGGFPTEAKGVLEKGIGTNAFTGESLARAQADLTRARAGADADRKDLPGADQALAAAKTGNEMVATGKLLFNVGQYDKAADAFRKGVAKGGVADVDDANALLGIALARSGKGAEAIEAFSKIRDPKLGEIGRLWKLYVETNAAAAAAPAPAAAPPAG